MMVRLVQNNLVFVGKAVACDEKLLKILKIVEAVEN